ncbi:hypothetical protein Poly30_50050 [Planctomycetes bacterium Poly30]|uniref:Phytanoyl-CoA dioxygenase (PhyH) n=1 Tax=Saltatorellus ferox TaxID=2528018 RepID=A0A518EZD0_9BACT|nr:hypothetical protein Poly30_50050 [Planctomycetes bacterium Poly30]
MTTASTGRPLIERRPRTTKSDELLDQLYAGEISLSSGTDSARTLARDAMEAVRAAFADVGDPALAQYELSNEDFFARVKTLRRAFYIEPFWRERVIATIVAAGLDPERTAYDPLKLRVVQSGGARNPAAAPVFQAHRDVWYSHPSCLVTWWIALHDAGEAETFTFYPHYLERPAPNDSERFDYRDWVKDGPDLKIGWQDIEAGRKAVFPSLTGEIESSPEAELGFRPGEGDELLFAGAHLHRTLAHESGRTRFSVDFRVIDTVHAAEGIGAPLVDARCLGSAVADYLPLSGVR